MQEAEKKVVYVLDEDSYLRYLLKIDRDRQITSHLLFGAPTDDMDDLSKSLLCEYYAALRHFEDVLEEMSQKEYFDKKTKSYVVPGKQALKFTVLFQSLVTIKEDLLKENCSLSLH